MALVLPLIVGVLFVGLLVLVLTRSRAAAPQPLVAPGPHGLAAAPSSWSAQVLGPSGLGPIGGALGSTYGTFSLREGRLAFTPDGDSAPAWDVPCSQLWVRRQGVGPFTFAAVQLHGPMGEVSCNVSREHINRFATNTLKDFRQAGYAGQFVAAVQAHGARVAA